MTRLRLMTSLRIDDPAAPDDWRRGRLSFVIEAA